MDFGKINKLVDEGYIKAQRHPSAPLTIYNYGPKTQYEWYWTPETKACRGLIVDDQQRIIARPFPKFFSADQTPRSDLIWSKPFTVTAKLDGSLGILYPAPNGPAIATRGSFVSSQAAQATEIIRTRYGGLDAPAGLTVLFEIILSNNRIVCDYGDINDLFLLTVIDNNTGADAALTPKKCADLIGWHGPLVDEFGADCKPRDVLQHLGLPQDGSVEGVVLRFHYPKGLHTRMKLKTDEYKRLHKLITGVNPRHIWEDLKEGRSLEVLLERVPDEYFKWVKEVESGLLSEYGAIEAECKSHFRLFETRKDAALYFQTKRYPSVLFAMLDGRDYAPHIWRMIRPEASAAFRCDVDAI